MAHCKGIAVLARLKWVQHHHGDDGSRRFFEALAPRTREVLERHVLPHGWVPMQDFIELNVVADRLFGKGDLELCKVMGAWAAGENLPKLFRLFYRLGSPTFIFERASKLWSAHYDSGSMLLTEPTAIGARLVLTDFKAPHRAHCLSVLGWSVGAIELAGSKVTSAERSAAERGATSGVYSP
jgi:hypothetical protein